jgi:hypothetical protein
MPSKIQPMMDPQREITDSNQEHKKVSFDSSGSGTVPIAEIGWIHHPRPWTVAALQTIFNLLFPVLRLVDLASKSQHLRLFDLFCLLN